MDIVDKLKSYHKTSGYSSTMRKAAGEIETLRATIDEVNIFLASADRNYNEKYAQFRLIEDLKKLIEKLTQ